MDAPSEPLTPWHALPLRAVAERLDVDPARGLDADEAAGRLVRFGRNVLPRAKPKSLLRVYLGQFTNPLIYLLMLAAGVSAAIGEPTDAAFIFAVLQLNAVVGTVQEWKAQSSALALDAMTSQWAVVVRDGLRQRIDAADVVPGDLLHVETGDRVPADLRLSSAEDVQADEALLTGESLPVAKSADAVLGDEIGLAERNNLLHAGTSLTSGWADGVVVATGADTEIGQISGELATRPATPPPLVVRLEAFTRNLGFFVMAAIGLLAAALVIEGAPPLEIFFVAVALAVSALPEGLPVAITVALSIGSARMARRNVIVRSLPAVEGLGACTLIASDKTGTLTCNALTIRKLVVPTADTSDSEDAWDICPVSGEGYNDAGAIRAESGALSDGQWRAVRRLAEAGALCNEATLDCRDGTWHHFGDTVDVAFLALAAKAGLTREAALVSSPTAAVVPYRPAKKYAASFHRVDGALWAMVKGAAEVVVPMCGGNPAGGADGPAGILARAETLAAEGYRVLALAAGRIDGVTPESSTLKDIDAAEDLLQGLEFLGFAGLIDPLRPGAAEAVETCRQAGIKVHMVTGDHPATALAIARDLSIAENRDQVVTGRQLDELGGTPERLAAVIGGASVFARVTPLQKLKIVDSLRAEGEVVAVTGDGVNDAPALNAADIGVAMGLGGTDAARSASDLILTDDNFVSIVQGVEQGRIAYDNVRKVVYLLISTGAAEVALFFLALISGLPLPLFAVQLLWLNLVTNGIQDVALAFEKGEADIVRRAPRPPNQGIFDRTMVLQTLASGAFMGGVGFAFFAWALDRGIPENEARGALLLLMVLFENAHVFNCRSERQSTFRIPLSANPLLITAVIASQGVHIAAMHLPGLSDVLKIQPVDAATWVLTALIGVSVVVFMEAFKLLRR